MLSKPKLSGMKRKAVAVTGGSELPRPSQQDWSCALCQVSATSKQGLDEHLQGKKHRANQALIEGKRPKAAEPPFGANKISRAKKAVGSTSVMKVIGKSLPAGGASSTNGPGKNRGEDRQLQTLQKKSYSCDVCKVKCNSKVMLASHLRGKKHMAQVEELKKDGKFMIPVVDGKKVQTIKQQGK